MKSNVDKMILAINSMRKGIKNDIIILIPLAISFIFSMIIAPIIIGVKDLDIIYIMPLCFAPLLCVCGILYIRRNLIIKKFMKEKNLYDKIEKVYIKTKEEFEELSAYKTFLFAYQSEYMINFLYNWINSCNAIKDNKLKMYIFNIEEMKKVYKVKKEYEKVHDGFLSENLNYVCIKYEDLRIDENNKKQFDYEFKGCVPFNKLNSYFEKEK